MLIVEARFYDDIADALLAGDRRYLKRRAPASNSITVPGSLEVPPAIAIALDAAQRAGKPYDGVVALGCVIRGETLHFEIVSFEFGARLDGPVDGASRSPLGNGIITVDTEAQALSARPRGRRRQGRRCGARRAGAWSRLKRRWRAREAHGARRASRWTRKANRRGAARLAAVQALYQMDIAGTGLNEVVAEFESHWIGREVEGEQYLPAEAAFFRDIVTGVVREQRTIDPLIDAALAKRWPLKRIEAMLRAVLRAGAYELDASPRRAGARGGFRICRRRRRFCRTRGDRHGQCGARPDRAAVARPEEFAGQGRDDFRSERARTQWPSPRSS